MGEDNAIDQDALARLEALQRQKMMDMFGYDPDEELGRKRKAEAERRKVKAAEKSKEEPPDGGKISRHDSNRLFCQFVTVTTCSCLASEEMGLLDCCSPLAPAWNRSRCLRRPPTWAGTRRRRSGSPSKRLLLRAKTRRRARGIPLVQRVKASQRPGDCLGLKGLGRGVQRGQGG